MDAAYSFFVHILRCDDSPCRNNGCVGISDARQFTRLTLKRDISSRYDGDSLCKQLTELPCGYHREVFKECHYLTHRIILVPFALVRSGIEGFV